MLVGAVSSPLSRKSTNKRSESLSRPSFDDGNEQEAWSAEGTTGNATRSSKMPKMKTKASAKKRFKITGTGKVVAQAAGKRHGMIKRSNKFIRDARGTMVLSDADARIVKKFLPNGL
jgi:large subunit ribosomal protein L35